MKEQDTTIKQLKAHINLLNTRVQSSEHLKSLIRVALEKDDAGENPAARMLQRQAKVFLCRKRLLRVIEARKKKKDTAAIAM